MNWDIVKKDFKRYLQLERNLSPHSIAAYLNDVQKLEAYCAFKGQTLHDIDAFFIQQFLVFINDFSISPFTQARLLSGLRTFFVFLQIEYDRKDNPTELLETPRLNRKIPNVLNIEEIDALIAAIDSSTIEGMRNKAILEVLYGCGLRVSELVMLKISNLYLDVEFIKVEGKGNKERLIPIGQQAIKYLKIYLEEVRPHIPVQAGYEDAVFLNRRGKQLTRVMVFLIIKDLAKKIGLTKTVSPHTFRHSFASHLVEGGADLRAVQDMLGHESITTTEIYTHMDKDYLQSVIIQYHPRS
ncbi:site-specific tyrosine recombinase XerD [Sphingobacterium sp. FBM7-1]|uniref:site-specific tyrosine recombinase XerD n=1 Tax=Sphingobacterium sp. FBM7-1 TaxID=2886688 RepID=UPI001D0F6CB9|nr:site-specific tyrosine recombinase XerD [Sphingobacterium sp. FBM7-1]MCC2598499.1 site-specific tyrosine recombinase XerD [Sphingobacterium sp. FBM7-1]